MIKNFRSRAMARIFNGDVRQVSPNMVPRIVAILDVLDDARSLEPLEKLTGFHMLAGNRAGTYSVTVTRNWRITFIIRTETVTDPDTNEHFEEFHVHDVDYEDYH